MLCSSGGQQHARHEKRSNNGSLNDTHRSHPKGKGGKKGGQKGKGSKKGQKGGKKGQKGAGKGGKYAGTLALFLLIDASFFFLTTLIASEMADFIERTFASASQLPLLDIYDTRIVGNQHGSAAHTIDWSTKPGQVGLGGRYFPIKLCVDNLVNNHGYDRDKAQRMCFSFGLTLFPGEKALRCCCMGENTPGHEGCDSKYHSFPKNFASEMRRICENSDFRQPGSLCCTAFHLIHNCLTVCVLSAL